MTVSTLYSRENFIAGQHLFQNSWNGNTTFNFCFATYFGVMFQWKSKITNKTNKHWQKENHLQTNAAHHVFLHRSSSKHCVELGFYGNEVAK